MLIYWRDLEGIYIIYIYPVSESDTYFTPFIPIIHGDPPTARHLMSDAAEVKLTGPAMPWRFPAGPGGAINGWCIPSGKHAKNYGKSQFLMGKLTISMAIFNSYVSHYQRVCAQATRWE